MKKKKSFNLNKFALMQGRLVDSEKKMKFNFSPKKTGRKNYNILKKIRLNTLSGLQVMKI